MTDATELFIVDNSEPEHSGLYYLREWCDLATSFDIATGFFEIGGLLELDGHWQKLDKIRILMGDEVSRRTKKARRAVRPPGGTQAETVYGRMGASRWAGST